MGYLFCREMGEPKCLFFVLLIWCLGTVHGQGYSISAQDSQLSCQKPKLDRGYFDSDKETYQHGTELYYACDKGRKPVVEGWWAMVKCENRKWSHIPQCIDENSCIAPENPNAKVKNPDVNGWYPNKQSVWFDCDSTHVIKGSISAKCENGTWTKLPLCVERDDLCGEPPLVTNAVITRKYQEKFQDGSKINYKCQDSYTLKETDSSVCISRGWTTAPECIPTPSTTERASTGEGGSSTSSDRGNGGTSSGGGHSTSSAQDSQLSCQKPKLDRGYFDSDKETYQHGTELYYACDKGRKPVVEGWWAMVKCENRKWSHIPQCIDENSCIAPENPNAKVKNPDLNGWYPNRQSVWFDCDSTHVIKGSITAKCENGTWTELPLCVERDDLCGEPPLVTNAVITRKYQEKFQDGSKINYKCQDSYTFEETDSSVCISGDWTTAPTCIPTPSPTERASTAQDSQLSCQKPKLDRGYFDSDKETYQHGTELYYACDKGRKPVVEGWWAMVKCENRKWSHIPQCIDENSCIAPENPNAKVKNPDVNGWYPNKQSVWFDCDSTHVIKGSISAKCENGTWTKLPLCVERDDLCGEPPLVTNAVITRKYQEKFQDGSKINYKCQDSYTLKETDSSVCISRGWTTAPECIPTPSTTERASTGEGGSSTSSDRGNGGTSSGGGHSTSSAQDSQLSCQKPKLDRGYFDSDKETYQHGTELYYACDKGRKPVVEGWWAMVKCENRKWSHIPQCIDENSCIAPENPNAKVKNPDLNGWYPNRQSVWFDCDSTHVIKGSITAKCENGTWTELPLCVERDDLCGEPPLVTNAVITRKYQEKFQDGSKINYKCQDSYTFEETDSSVCISGDWTTAPTCIPTPSPTERASTAQDSQLSCQKPKLDRGYFDSDKETYQHGTELYYACDKGRKPVVEGWWAMVKCENRKWSHIPQCIDENSCIAPENPNAKVKNPDVNGWYPNKQSVWFDCDSTHVIKGSISAKCENGTWTKLPLCVERDDLCGEPPLVTNAVITRKYQEKFQDGSKINYKCQDSYTLKETDSSVCISRGWTTAPECIPTPSTTERASTGEGGSSTSSDRGNGGTSSGGGHSTSSAQDSQLSCQKPKLDRGYFDSDKETYQHGTELYYACDKGRKPVVEGWWAMVKCENRKWSHIPQCIDENSCIAPENPNAKVKNPDVNGWYPNKQSVWFDCDSTHVIKGSISAKCENGTWTELPLCVERDDLCGEPPLVTNAVITRKYQEKFQDGSKINYKCQDSYTFEETDSSVCISGDWTTAPTCKRASTGEGGSSTSSDRGNGATSSGGDHSTSSRGGVRGI
ncbi:complement factor H-like isoform X3 [Salvelinus alpinus]|uniref:complement factor H-like isoform X3 n=1 Tax=Salvelinus alpinus TaxID=8036 RepID=UPI0039FDCE47